MLTTKHFGLSKRKEWLNQRKNQENRIVRNKITF